MVAVEQKRWAEHHQFQLQIFPPAKNRWENQGSGRGVCQIREEERRKPGRKGKRERVAVVCGMANFMNTTNRENESKWKFHLNGDHQMEFYMVVLIHLHCIFLAMSKSFFRFIYRASGLGPKYSNGSGGINTMTLLSFIILWTLLWSRSTARENFQGKKNYYQICNCSALLHNRCSQLSNSSPAYSDFAISAEEMEQAAVHNVPRKPRILLAASGSVASIKFGTLCTCFSEWADVKAVATSAALSFIDRSTIPRNVTLYTDENEWSTWQKIGDSVLHIELRRWADIMVIAPLSANTLGKLAGGLCDNLLTCIVRAWDYEKPIFVAPAMNTMMWNNPFTERHLMALDELGVSLIPPVSKRLACGDYGNGAMAEPSFIFSTIRLFVERRTQLAGPSSSSAGNN